LKASEAKINQDIFDLTVFIWDFGDVRFSEKKILFNGTLSRIEYNFSVHELEDCVRDWDDKVILRNILK